MGQIDEWERLSDRFSLIPLNGKVPIEQGWQRWCEEKRLFSPKDFSGHNAGVACGPASGVLVLDIDHEKLFRQTLKTNGWTYEATMTVRTGSDRYHLYFEYPKNGHRYGCTSYKTNVLGETITVFDVRGCGGQVVGPESIHPDTKKPYKIVRDIPCSPAPEWLTDLVMEKPKQPDSKIIQFPSTWNGRIDDLPISESVKDCIHSGRNVGDRSEAIMSVCNALVYANLSDSDIIGIFESYPIGEKYREKGRSKERWLAKHIRKARDYVTEHAEIITMSTMSSASSKSSLSSDGNNVISNHQMSSTCHQECHQVPGRASERNLTAEVKEWVEEADGRFSSSDLDKDLGIRTRQDKVTRAKIVERLIKENKIERYGAVRGHYQTIDGNCPLVNFINVDSTRAGVILPFDLSNYFFIQPKNIVILAGDSNSGKTAAALWTMYQTINFSRNPLPPPAPPLSYKNNYNSYFIEQDSCQSIPPHVSAINYYSSEMGPAEWNRRLSKTGIPLDWWARSCNIFQRSDNFHQVIDPNGISFIDYLEIHEDFYRVGGMIKAIFDRLVNGVAVISIQKNRGQTLGLGGNRGIEKARLYLTIRESQPHGFTMTIEKGKNPIGPNMSHHECDFKIVDGWKLHQETPWTRIEEDKRHA